MLRDDMERVNQQLSEILPCGELGEYSNISTDRKHGFSIHHVSTFIFHFRNAGASEKRRWERANENGDLCRVEALGLNSALLSTTLILNTPEPV